MDGLMTTLLGLSSLAAFAGDESGAGLALGALGGLFLASAIRGNTAANECRAAYSDYAVVMQAQRQQQLAEEPAPRPRPVATRKKPPKPKPVAEPVVEVPVEQAPPVEPQPPPEVATPYATPRPAVTKQPDAPRKKPPAKRTDDAGDDEWSSFWKEAP